MGYLAENLVNRLINNQIINNEDRAIYKFGLEVFISTATKIILLTIISFLLNMTIEMFVFTSTFFILRINAGGYHLETFMGCFAVTVIATFSTIAIIKIISPSAYLIFFFLILANIIVFLYAPVDTPNKPLTSKERLIYRKRSLIYIGLYTLVIIITFSVKPKIFYLGSIGVMALFLESITLIPLLNKDK